MEIEQSPGDSRALLIRSTMGRNKRIGTRGLLFRLFICYCLAMNLLFDDNIRSLAARQRLSKGRQRARHLKLQKIANLLDLPANFLQVL